MATHLVSDRSDRSVLAAAEDVDRKRRMLSAKLLGKHTHTTSDGRAAHIYERDGTFLARLRFDGRQIAETLGEEDDAVRSFFCLVEIEAHM